MNPWLAASAGTAAALGSIAYTIVAPACTFWGPIISRAPVGTSGVSLTFDDGPTAPSTEKILDVLAEEKVKAAFFVIGVNVRKHPDLVRRMHAEGHLVGNHSLDHSHYGWMRGPAYWSRQFDTTSDLIAEQIGQRPAMFRPPLGVKQYFILSSARRRGMRTIAWTRRAWDCGRTTPEAVLANLTPNFGGEILTLHDGIDPFRHRDPAVSIAVVRPLIEHLRREGRPIVRLDELLGLPAYHPDIT